MSTNNETEFNHVQWSRNANIYEVNIRQYSEEGSFVAFEKHLPRLAKMGVDIIWLMPVHPIGELNRKGTLGSEYSVKDYLGLCPEFGTIEDFKHLVKETHKLGMKLIIDWVANHTAWDHPWTKSHPDWYKKNDAGEIEAYNFFNGKEMEYWTDVVGLDYENRQLWTAMTDALKYWVVETDIDGYRCDVAGLVPIEFWVEARAELEKIKPIFMLAEWSTPEMHKAFDMTYSWDLWDIFVEMHKGNANALTLRKHIEDPVVKYSKDSYRMLFTTNHDKNSWEYDDLELYGDGFEAFAVLCATLPGMPLIYTGQETLLDKKISFFEKDVVDFKNYENVEFYTGLLKLKKDNVALWNGQYGGDITVLPVTDKNVLAFTRSKDENTVTVIINFSAEEQQVNFSKHETITLSPWGYSLKY